MFSHLVLPRIGLIVAYGMLNEVKHLLTLMVLISWRRDLLSVAQIPYLVLIHNTQAMSHSVRTADDYIGYWVFVLGVVYVIVTIIGFLQLPSPDHPIADPYFAIMELLSMVIPLLMSFSLAALHTRIPDNQRRYSLLAVIFMALTTGITSIVHTMVLSMRTYLPQEQVSQLDFLLAFKWPSVAYALDILAWDWFFALSMLSTALALKSLAGTRAVQLLMVVSGLLSWVGLIGLPLSNMQLRDIGIIGYAIVAPVAFLLLTRKLNQGDRQC